MYDKLRTVDDIRYIVEYKKNKEKFQNYQKKQKDKYILTSNHFTKVEDADFVLMVLWENPEVFFILPLYSGKELNNYFLKNVGSERLINPKNCFFDILESDLFLVLRNEFLSDFARFQKKVITSNYKSHFKTVYENWTQVFSENSLSRDMHSALLGIESKDYSKEEVYKIFFNLHKEVMCPAEIENYWKSKKTSVDLIADIYTMAIKNNKFKTLYTKRQILAYEIMKKLTEKTNNGESTQIFLDIINS